MNIYVHTDVVNSVKRKSVISKLLSELLKTWCVLAYIYGHHRHLICIWTAVKSWPIRLVKRNTKTVLLACAFYVYFVEKRQPAEMAALPYLRCCIDVKHRPLPSSKHVNVLHYYTCAPSRGIEGHKSFQQQK